MEHAAGELRGLGDALGVDCTVVRLVDGWTRAYEGDGRRSADWYGWNEPLLSPATGVVENIVANDVENKPGILGAPTAASITFIREDGIRVLYAHVRDVAVVTGQEIEAGAMVARIGNNGMARHPHVHLGAWRGETPLQVRFDLVALGRLRALG